MTQPNHGEGKAPYPHRHLFLWLCLLGCVMLWMPRCGPSSTTDGGAEPATEIAADQRSESASETATDTTTDSGTEPGAEPSTPDDATTSEPGKPEPTEPPAGDNATPDNTPGDQTADAPPSDRAMPPDDAPDQATPEPTMDTSPPETTADAPKKTSIALRAQLVTGKTGQVLSSNGIPFAAGVVTSLKQLRLMDGSQEIPIFVKSLAKWKDGSHRAVLVQFQRAASAFPANLQLEIGVARTTTDRSETAVSWTLPQAVAFPTAAYISQSLAFGRLLPLNADQRFATYDKNAVTYYNQHKGDKDWGNDARSDGYYSTTLTWYLLFLRSGDIERYQWARREAVHYREDQITKSGSKAGTMNGRNEPRYLYLQAMEIDYLLNGDPKTLQTAGLMAKYLQGLHPASWYHYKKTDTRFWTERRAAFPLLGLTVYGRWTGDQASLQMAKQILDNILKTQQEWPDGGWLHSLYAHDSSECGDRNAYGGSPFMTGLLFEALINYYLWTKDARIVPAIKKATSWLWSKGWKSDSFLYMIGCGSRYTSGVPDLNLLIAHGFAFVYWAGGKSATDQKRAWDVFNQGVANAYLKTRKHYNQNYRSSYAFLWYITQ